MYQFQDGELLTADKLNNVTAEIDENISNVAEEKIRVGNTWYQASGIVKVTPGSWTKLNTDLYASTPEIVWPIPEIPDGYFFAATIVNAPSTYTVASALPPIYSKKTFKVRLMQFGSAAITEITLAWRLVKGF